MTRADLEAIIWRHARMLTGTVPEMCAAVDTILAAADAYAATLRHAQPAGRHT